MNNLTEAEITYTYIGLNEMGNQLNKEAINRMYKRNLEDWEEEIEDYLAKRKDE